ncbi:cytochrome P450 [Thozetella sp. PMI_491]|nr:cytochrome P450 [Thozetella sp. PMI_491]
MTLVKNGMNALDTQAIAVCLILGIGLWIIIANFWSWYRLSHIPGPRLASVSYAWVGYNTIKGLNYEAYQGLRAYGSLVRVGPNSLVSDDPDVFRRMSGIKSSYRRDTWYLATKFTYDMDTTFSIIDTAEHDKLKAKIIGGYSSRENPDLEASVDSQVLRLVDLIRRKYLSKGEDLCVADFAHLSRCFTMDVITRLGHGKPFGYLDEGDDIYGWLANVDKIQALMVSSMDIPWLRRITFSYIGLLLLGPKSTDRTGVGKVMGITKDLIVKRFNNEGPDTPDMFNGLIHRGVSQRELEAEALVQLIAGSDTTASTIQSTMLHIMTTPSVYGRLKTEIKQAVEQGKVSSPISQSEALRLPYLQAVIWEGYRIRNPVPYGQYKVVPPEGDTIDGLFVPGGTAVGHNTAALTRRKDIFGADVDIFRPERFLECSPEQKLAMDRALDITFGGGRWMCAGKSVAVMELNKVFFELLREFDFQLVNPVSPWAEQSYLINCHRDMFVKIAEPVPLNS